MRMKHSKSQDGADGYDAERYLLGEMSAAEQEEFEARMFESPELGEEVVELHAFAANAKAVMEEDEEAASRPAERSERKLTWGDAWAAWLRPGVFWPAAAAALTVVVAYQAFVSVPRLREELAAIRSPQAVATTFLRPLTRGDENVVVPAPGQPLVRLSFDLNWSSRPDDVLGQVTTDSGETVAEFAIASEDLNETMELSLPADALSPGRYTLRLFSRSADVEERFELEVRRSP